MELFTGTIVSIIFIFAAIKSIELVVKIHAKVKYKLDNRHRWGKLNEDGKRY